MVLFDGKRRQSSMPLKNNDSLKLLQLKIFLIKYNSFALFTHEFKITFKMPSLSIELKNFYLLEVKKKKCPTDLKDNTITVKRKILKINK